MSERRGVIVDNGVVTNIVVWGDQSEDQFSEEGHDRVEETTGWEHQPGIGWTWTPEFGYRPPQPYPSWVWDAELFEWVAPIPQPPEDECENGWWSWDEEGQEWVCNQPIEE
jgi:hypothetical protein